MVYDGFWHIQAAVSRELGSEAEVPIFTVRDKILVKEPDVVEHCATIQGRSRGRPEDIIGCVELPSIPLTMPEAVGKTTKAQSVSCPIEETPVVEVYQLAREETGLRVPVRSPYQGREPLRVLLRVVVQERHEFGLGSPYTGVYRHAKAPVFSQRHGPDLRKVSRRKVQRAIRRAVVDQ